MTKIGCLVYSDK